MTASAAPLGPVTQHDCWRIVGPFYHGTRVQLTVGDLLCAGRLSNYEAGRVMRHVYFSACLEPAVWAAELAAAAASARRRGHIYIVEPTGPFEDDPNLTNKRFRGNPTRSFRSRDPLRVVGEVEHWTGHTPEAIDARLASLQALRRQGRAIIED